MKGDNKDCDCGREDCAICEWRWMDDADLDSFGA